MKGYSSRDIIKLLNADGRLLASEGSNIKAPEPTMYKNIKLDSNQQAVLLEVYLAMHREACPTQKHIE